MRSLFYIVSHRSRVINFDLGPYTIEQARAFKLKKETEDELYELSKNKIIEAEDADSSNELHS